MSSKKPFWKKLVDSKIGTSIHFVAYVKQSFMAITFLLFYFFSWNYFFPIKNQIIFSALASSTFLAFISTGIYDSLSRKIIGGQIVGVFVGISLWYSLQYFQNTIPQFKEGIFIIFLSLSAGFALFFMAIFNFEHPPAAGTAMAFVFNKQSPQINDIFFIVVCVVLLAYAHHLVKKHQMIKDLEGKKSKPIKIRKRILLKKIFNKH